MKCSSCHSENTKKIGFFRRKRNHRKIQRYLCKDCKTSFSNQTFSITYQQKRPDLNTQILSYISTGTGIRRTAKETHTSKKTVQRKIKFLAKVCDKFHQENMSKWTRKGKPQFVFDEMETIESTRTNTIHIPTVVEKESYFIVGIDALYASSRSHYPNKKKDYNELHKEEISNKNLYTKKVLGSCRKMKPQGRIVVYSDEKPGYAKMVKEVFGDLGVHLTFNAAEEDEKNKLFPVNNTMACLRAENAMLRRATWYVCKDKNMLSNHLKIYTFHHNYVREKGYTVGYTKSGCRKPEEKTPAQHLGICDKVIEPKTLVGF